MLPWVLDYVGRQKEHHAKGSIVAKLEIAGIDESAGNRVQEEAAEYGDRDLPAEPPA